MSKFLKIGKRPNERQSSFLGFTRKKSRNEEINYEYYIESATLVDKTKEATLDVVVSGRNSEAPGLHTTSIGQT